MRRLVFGISGASGMPLAMAILARLATVSDLETHLIISVNARLALRAECGTRSVSPEKFAHAFYAPEDMAAPPASGSWPHDGMLICPCSMSSLAAIASGSGVNLIHRAADVTLKERRPLILVIRETPFSLIHIRNMEKATEAGAIIMPFIPGFYAGERSLADIMRQFAGRLLDLLRVPSDLCVRWGEAPLRKTAAPRARKKARAKAKIFSPRHSFLH